DLSKAYGVFWQVQAAARLLTGSELELEDLGEGGRGFVLRQTGAESFEGLSARINAQSDRAASIVEAALARVPGAVEKRA
ncbi:MAG: hypothetical protein QNJ16_17080, partial [Rhodobacter sp.]|nr:hypothetical protein [Rhodobacter sp.]